MIWLTTALGWAKSAASAALGMFGRWPWQAGCIALACLSVWLWRGWDAESAGRRDDTAKVTAAQAEATRLAKEALAHQESVYREKAVAADHDYAASLADARDATAAYSAAHRVQPDGGSPSCAAAPAAAGGSAGVPAGMPADSLVAVTDADMHACAGAVTYALNAHDWAAGVAGE